MEQNAKKMRDWGLGASIAVILVSLGVALLGGAPTKAAPAAVEPEHIAPIVNAPTQSAPTAPAPAPPLSFTIRFAPEHPMAHAQDLQAQGRLWEAHAEAERILAARRDLIGLCFDRFSPGAEIVLKPCRAVSRNQEAQARRYWLARFQAMPGVSYVEANVILRRAAAR